ncbi:hypothetical protein [Amycolatopsis sp. YIM 10]|uniref:hypothetical protein n=1 Tax=Amycolatopsis sp. YIM 10 TaxID=2653857 RepID=UPI00128FD5C2|nr:hypothetical protein [Amycolatopsis sp. YIM 10]QFU87273.1 hypothetical protein YIM_10340 [Amycolatopsis sp. YIM 10]
MSAPQEPVESDPAALNSAEDLDEDRLRVDPLEAGIEPPEHWSAADRFGTTPAEQREGESMAARLSEEQPDVTADEVPEKPIAATPADELDESIDDQPGDVEQVAPEEGGVGRHTSSDELPQAADQAGGSVAEAIRTPE